jgi:nickel/cobalt transporter (NiCoT) family protein
MTDRHPGRAVAPLAIRRIFDDEPGGTKVKIWLLYVVLISANALCWMWAFVQFRGYPLLLGTASLAYTFGLRHAVDPDHIAAIDNVTRKLMQAGKRPIAAGLFFALGHSTVVIVASILLALSVGALEVRFAGFREIGGVIGTSISAAFLLVIALINTVILMSVYRTFTAVRRGEQVIEEDLHKLLDGRGFLTRMLRSLFAVVTRSGYMFPLGLLFGLGFDTATEIGVLGISAAQGSVGLPIWSILVFPTLFAAGMSLIDTTDSVLMVQAYGWAFVKPVRKLYYNLTMTFISIVVAFLIGGLEVLGLAADKFGFEGPLWALVGRVNDHFGLIGYLVIAVFLSGWMISVLIYRAAGFDEIRGKLSADRGR